jgi:hypothetical protein
MPVIEVSLEDLSDPEAADIFVETEGNVYFRKPRLMQSKDRTTVWQLVADGYGKPPELAGKLVRLTIADGEIGLVHEEVLK